MRNVGLFMLIMPVLALVWLMARDVGWRSSLLIVSIMIVTALWAGLAIALIKSGTAQEIIITKGG